MDLTNATLIEIRDAIHRREITAVEVTEFFLDRISSHDPKINAYISLNDQAVEEARRVDEAIVSGAPLKPLAGLPIAVKDLLCTRGLRTTAGSRALSTFVPPYSATVVERLRNAGGVVIGKTNLDEFAMGSSTETSAFGVCRNPWNLEYVPGGSSGGSAAALAARLAPAAIGTDTGGSIRQPASFCGVVGLKPTYGRVSRFGMIAFASSLDQAGPMARTVRDSALLLEVISGRDEWDTTTADRVVPAWSTSIQTDIRGTRVGLLKETISDQIDADVRAAIDSAQAELQSRGAEIVEVSIPLLRYAISVYYLIATSEASSNLARYDGIRFGSRTVESGGRLDEFYSKNRAFAFGSEVKRRIMLGTHALSSGHYDAYYQKACQVRRKLQDEYRQAFVNCDVILGPVATSPAFKIGARVSDPMAMYLNDIFTTGANLAGLPGLSVPAGFSSAGLPMGVQLTARPFDEQILFNIGAALESAGSLHKMVPDGF